MPYNQGFVQILESPGKVKSILESPWVSLNFIFCHHMEISKNVLENSFPHLFFIYIFLTINTKKKKKKENCENGESCLGGKLRYLNWCFAIYCPQWISNNQSLAPTTTCLATLLLFASAIVCMCTQCRWTWWSPAVAAGGPDCVPCTTHTWWHWCTYMPVDISETETIINVAYRLVIVDFICVIDCLSNCHLTAEVFFLFKFWY